MADRTELVERRDFRKAALKELRAAYLELVSGRAKSYTIDDRTLTRLDLPQLKREITDAEKELDGLDALLEGGSRRKAVGVIPRDW